MDWNTAIKQCGRYPTPTAQSLYVKAKRGDRLTTKQISTVFMYARRVNRLYGNKTVSVKMGKGMFPLVVNGYRIDRKGDWVVWGEVVLGKIKESTLTLYPNGPLHPLDIARLCTDTSST